MVSQPKLSQARGSFYPTVGKIVAVRALSFNRIHCVSNTSAQLIQQQSLGNSKIQQISISLGIWFGTRGPILSNRYNHFGNGSKSTVVNFVDGEILRVQQPDVPTNLSCVAPYFCTRFLPPLPLPVYISRTETLQMSLGAISRPAGIRRFFIGRREGPKASSARSEVRSPEPASQGI